jgi:phenylacetyl-CoA:acceptor oxidoreductase 26-kDa subunit
MSNHSGFGPNPWQQTSWDWRAAGNFMAGGAGSGLLIANAVLATPASAQAWVPNWLVFAGLALVGLGLLCVWLEIGRPLRALHVFFNARTSWMTREAFVAGLLFPFGLLVFLGMNTWGWLLTLSALAFLYCQSRMLPAARGIPAWRPTLLAPLMFFTGLCEGCGVLLLLGWFWPRVNSTATLVLAVLIMTRFITWSLYRVAVEASLAAGARSALNRVGRALLFGGTLAPLILLGIAAWRGESDASNLAAALAGATAALAGVYFKFILVTRASFNQGFALKQIPVRGVQTNASSRA